LALVASALISALVLAAMASLTCCTTAALWPALLLPANVARLCSVCAPDASTDTSPAPCSCSTSSDVSASDTWKSAGAGLTVAVAVWHSCAPSASAAHM
jgi:hypothetical protein